MMTVRNVRKSAMTRVRALLAAPPVASGIAAPYTLYDIRDLRSAYNNPKAFTQARPSCFVIEGRVRPMVGAFPLVMVAAQVVYQTFELGNTSGGLATIDLNVVGRMSGERDDLAGLFAKYWGRSLPLYNYSGGSTGTLIENALLRDHVEVFDDDIDTEAIRANGSYDYWEVVRLQADFLSA